MGIDAGFDMVPRLKTEQETGRIGNHPSTLLMNLTETMN